MDFRSSLKSLLAIVLLVGWASTSLGAESWVIWARRVGQSETEELRTKALGHLKRDKHLNEKLLPALDTPERALALDVIGALRMKTMVPQLLAKVEADTDGFLTLAVNSLLDEQNKALVFSTYTDLLKPEKVSKVAPAVIFALLEPLGRVGHPLKKQIVANLLQHTYPEVKGAALSYVRAMGLTHKSRDYDDLLGAALKAREFQVRLQVVALYAELSNEPGRNLPLTRDQVSASCQSERHAKVREHCHSFLRKTKGGAEAIAAFADEDIRAILNRPAATLAVEREPAMNRVLVMDSSAASACKETYKRFYSKPVTNFRMIFGYKDTRPARFVGDHHERLAFVQRLLAPCSTNGACGFVRSTENADLFMKTISGPEGKRSKIQVWVAHSSVGSDDQSNRTDLFQVWQSAYARSAFYGGLAEADAVFYNGHSRFGGGPDFEPPRLIGADQVDTAYYQNQKPGLTKALEVFQVQGFKSSTDHQLKVLGLFSCGSSQHFTDEIRQYSNVGIISSRNLIYYADALDNSVNALSALLEMRCRRDFNAAIHNGAPAKGMRLQGFLPK